MSRRRKRKNEEVGMDEAWLLPYADLLTLLLALFIVLFSTSAVDAQKFHQLSQVFNGIFIGGTGPIDYQQPVENHNHSSDFPKKTTTDQDDEAKEEESSIQSVLGFEDMKELEHIQGKLNNYIQQNDLHNKFNTSLTSEGLLLTIRDNVLFSSGRAEVREKDKDTAHELAILLEMEPPRNIVISGHTDNVPIGSANYQSNWELSVMRAINFMKVLMEDKNL